MYLVTWYCPACQKCLAELKEQGIERGLDRTSEDRWTHWEEHCDREVMVDKFVVEMEISLVSL